MTGVVIAWVVGVLDVVTEGANEVGRCCKGKRSPDFTLGPTI